MLLVVSFVILGVVCQLNGERLEHVTCGSVLKLENTYYKVRLHSHDIKYGSGSGQQSVTGADKRDDHNSHWLVKPKKGESCERGERIKCNGNIRLEHVATGKNLHSHHFTAPMSHQQEISAFGTNGEGDSGDHWKVLCSTDFWERDGQVRFKHDDTDAFLSLSGQTFGRPISGQYEVVGVMASDSSSYWKAAEGVFIKPSLADPKFISDGAANRFAGEDVHSEL